jgi:hypothetical protein
MLHSVTPVTHSIECFAWPHRTAPSVQTLPGPLNAANVFVPGPQRVHFFSMGLLTQRNED